MLSESYTPVAIILLNLVLFVSLGVYVLHLSKRARFGSVRLLWLLPVPPVAALLVGSVSKLVVQAARIGWLPKEGLNSLLHGWQVVQSMTVAAIAVIALLQMTRLGRRLSDLELLAGRLLDPVSKVELAILKLTPREWEVLRVIGSSSLIDDNSLAEKLSVAPSTVHTHVLSLLRKTKLNNRHELSLLAYLDRQYQRDFGSSTAN